MANITTKADLYYPNTSAIDNDFIGFSFNGVSSQSLGISRVSDGSRYNEQMLPGFQDKSAQMPGSDYTLYWESFYNTKTWTIDIAFDYMTDAQMSLLRKTFHTKNMGNLTFTERNGIHWLAKVQAPPQLKYICFETDEYRQWNYDFIVGYKYYIKNGNDYVVTQDTSPQDGNVYYEHVTRIYKGEGTIQLVAYYPFGMSDLQTLSVATTGTIVINNGEIPMEWYLDMTVPSLSNEQNYFVVKAEVNNIEIGMLYLSKNFTLKTGDTHFRINSKTNLIEGLDSNNNQTGNVYNNFIIAGDFFKLPVGESKFFSTGTLYYNFLYL